MQKVTKNVIAYLEEQLFIELMKGAEQAVFEGNVQEAAGILQRADGYFAGNQDRENRIELVRNSCQCQEEHNRQFGRFIDQVMHILEGAQTMYSAEELETCQRQLTLFKQLGARGFVALQVSVLQFAISVLQAALSADYSSLSSPVRAALTRHGRPTKAIITRPDCQGHLWISMTFADGGLMQFDQVGRQVYSSYDLAC